MSDSSLRETPFPLSDDPEGAQTLEAMAVAPAFNRWMFETIAPHLVSPVLEIGSGIGNLSAQVLASGHSVMLSDLRLPYCRQLQHQFSSHTGCLGVQPLDLVHPRFREIYAPHLGRFASVFSLNVLEHIEDDQRALANAYSLLRPGGRLIILVPAYRLLFNRFDEALGHFRRYTRSTLETRFRDSGFEGLTSFYFNLAGVPGWFVSGSLLRQRVLRPWQLRIYNALVPIFRCLDWVTWRRFGLSVVTIGQVPLDAQVAEAA